MNKSLLSTTTAWIGLIVGLMLLPSKPALGGYQWPVEKPTYITATFGEYRPGHLHDGIDFSVQGRRNRDALAIERGVVERVLYDPDVYGQTVVVRHPNGQRSWYSHLDSIAPVIRNSLDREVPPYGILYPGKPVRLRAGDPVGTVGETGRGFVHLHLSVQNRSGEFINPYDLFSPSLPLDVQPEAPELIVVPGDSSWVNQGPEPARFQPGDLVNLYGSLEFELDVGLGTAEGNQVLPRRVELFRDGERLARRDFSRIPTRDDQGRLARHFNLTRSHLGPTRFQLQLGDAGIRFDEEGTRGELGVRVTSNSGKVWWYEFDYAVNRPANPHHPDEINWPESVYEPEKSSGLSVTYAAGRFWFGSSAGSESEVKLVRADSGDTRTLPIRHEVDGTRVGWWEPGEEADQSRVLRLVQPDGTRVDRSLSFAGSDSTAISMMDAQGRWTVRIPETSGTRGNLGFHPQAISNQPEGLELLSGPIRLAPPAEPLPEGTTLTARLAQGVKRPHEAGLFRFNAVADEWKPIGFDRGFGDREVMANIYQGGLYAVFCDTSPPTLDEPRLIRNGDKLRFPLYDSQVPLRYRDISVFLDGQPLPFEHNRDRQWLDVTLPDDASGTLVVRVRNRADLLTRFRTDLEDLTE